MTQDPARNPDERPLTPAATPPSPSERPRQSLRDLALKASQTPVSKPAPPPPAPPSLPPSLPAPPSSSVKPVVTELASTAEPEAVERGSGPPTSSVTVPAPAAPAAARSSRSGLAIGVGVAVIGIAAALAMQLRHRAPAPSVTVAAELKTQSAAVAPEQAKPTVASEVAAPKPTEAGTNVDSLPDKVAAVAKDPAANNALPGKAGAVEKPSTANTASPVAALPNAPAGKPGDLMSEMEKHAGKGDAPKAEADSAPTTTHGGSNGSTPEVPSQGSVSAAVASVMGAAKACVAGGDDVSRAQVTFGASGAVKNVVVTGWAAANGQSSCVRAAFQSANVGAFSKPSYTFSATIRP